MGDRMRLFVDLDGVLADFDAGASRVLGMTPTEFQQLHGAALMWKRLAAAPRFYAELPWMADGKDLWTALQPHLPAPMVLTGLPLGTWAEPEKREWCRRELGPGVIVTACMSIDKHLYCCADDILIDDRESARLDWVTAGGRFVLHTSTPETLAALREMGALPAA